jgi:hypothetical protein
VKKRFFQVIEIVLKLKRKFQFLTYGKKLTLFHDQKTKTKISVFSRPKNKKKVAFFHDQKFWGKSSVFLLPKNKKKLAFFHDQKLTLLGTLPLPYTQNISAIRAFLHKEIFDF